MKKVEPHRAPGETGRPLRGLPGYLPQNALSAGIGQKELQSTGGNDATTHRAAASRARRKLHCACGVYRA
ncbi:MAG: hypothetical protein LBG79_00630 [Spirochaetaceae bacterium]|jgi:hypothetical protein|nr:hypothetical protein [Spirochaetaceae bacterium]